MRTYRKSRKEHKSAGTHPSEISDGWVLFRTQRGLPLYHIKRRIEELDTPFGDGSHIVYANGAYSDDETDVSAAD